MSDKQVLFEPIYAWKVWRVITAIEDDRWVFGKYMLISPLYLYERWPYRAAYVAKPACPLDPYGKISEVSHKPPNLYCGCGIYAFKQKEDAFRYFQNERRHLIQWNITFAHIKGNEQEKPRDCFAIGKISLWGDIVEHEKGYRAEFAYPYEITLLGGDESIASSLREQYQIDVRLK